MLSDDKYEPMSAEEIEEALRDCDYDPLSEFIEDESSIAPAVPEEQDQYKAPKLRLRSLGSSLGIGSSLEASGRATIMLPISNTFKPELFDPVFIK